MFERVFKVTVPANATTVNMPLGVDNTAMLEVTDRNNPEQAVKIWRSSGGTGVVNINPSTAERKLQISVTQLNPLAATHGAVPDWTANTEYFKNELVFWRNRVYRANEDLKRGHPYFNTAYPHWSQWTNIVGDTGNVVFRTQFDNESSGYWPMDGTVINAPWSMFHGQTAPNALGQLLAAAGQFKISGNVVRTLAVGPNASLNSAIALNQLPTTDISVSVSGASAGTPSGSVSMDYSGTHQHDLASCGSGSSSSYFDHNVGGSATDVQYYSQSVRPAGSHIHPAYFSGSAMSAHGHPATVKLNQSGTQQALAYHPANFGIVPHIRL